ncbi:MAG TPA: hypothetical protein VLV15_17310 [Dongiaceae bacterium]|nr:hypothetical protein [Dongiaceae bacterium]
MLMMITGAVLLVLGLASGVLLVLAPFGIGGVEPSLLTWGMFPVLTLLGYLFVALAARARQIAPISQVTGAVLLVLALVSIVCLFAVGNSLVKEAGSTLPLWYVTLVGLVLGPLGLWFRRGGGDTGTT